MMLAMVVLVVALALANAGLIWTWARSHRVHPDDPHDAGPLSG
jgi:hypothetical protein